MTNMDLDLPDLSTFVNITMFLAWVFMATYNLIIAFRAVRLARKRRKTLKALRINGPMRVIADLAVFRAFVRVAKSSTAMAIAIIVLTPELRIMFSGGILTLILLHTIDGRRSDHAEETAEKEAVKERELHDRNKDA